MGRNQTYRKVLKEVPGAQSILLPSQLVYLSKDHMDFGRIPAGSLLREIVLIRNASGQHVSFEWKIEQSKSGVPFAITIEPSSGLLTVGETRVCRFTAESRFVSQIYDAKISCVITDEDETVSDFR